MKYSHIDTIVQEITDSDYYFMIENQIRKEIPKFEVGVLLNKAISVLNNNKIKNSDLDSYSVEGYYSKTPSLTHYFTIIRNLQDNQEIYDRVDPDDKDLQFLQEYLNNNLWGEQDYGPFASKGPIHRRRDFMTNLLEDKSFDSGFARPWNIDSIMELVRNRGSQRENLVALAALTQDPKCLCSGMETNSLSRQIAHVTGWYSTQAEYSWNVSKSVENLGKVVIKGYNDLFGSHMIVPDIYNHLELKKTGEYPRVAVLGRVVETKEMYHWIIDKKGELYDVYSPSIISAENIPPRFP